MTRILVHGMQSSGASAFALLLGQRPESVCVADLYNPFLAPWLDTELPVVLKAVVTTTWSIDQHAAAFKPDRTVLFVRNPYDVCFSLLTKPYADQNGHFDDKLREMDRLFAERDRFDLVVHYEDFVGRRSETVAWLRELGWPAGEADYELRRGPEEITVFNEAHVPWCRQYGSTSPDPRWGMGNVDVSRGVALPSEGKPLRECLLERVCSLSPTLSRHYGLDPVADVPSRGITYVAWGVGIEEAERSAASARRYGVKSCLISPGYSGDGFERVLTADAPLRFPADKVSQYARTPWDVTLLLDSDTMVLGELDFGFQMAERHGLAVVVAPNTSFVLHYGVRGDRDAPQYNGGVLFWDRRRPVYSDLWRDVQAIMEAEAEDWSVLEENPALNDQSALSRYLHERGFNPYVLPLTWNLRPQFGMTTGYGPIKILHSRHKLPEGFSPRQEDRWTLEGFILDRSGTRALRLALSEARNRLLKKREENAELRKQLARVRGRMGQMRGRLEARAGELAELAELANRPLWRLLLERVARRLASFRGRAKDPGGAT
ncbi:MAG TPA: hypothetical protein VGA70_13945 [Longimicrobiales bacterium]|jgi:hypothetical protein